MLINKQLLEYRYIIPRHTDYKYLKYLLDLDYKLIVNIYFEKYYHTKLVSVITPSERWSSQCFREGCIITPLTNNEIKLLLMYLKNRSNNTGIDPIFQYIQALWKYTISVFITTKQLCSLIEN